jgi:cell division protein FtsW
MKKRYRNKNIWLVAAFSLLILLGIIMVYSSSAFYAQQYFGDHFYFLKRHLVWLFLGLIAMAAAYSFPYQKFQGYYWILLLVATGILFYCAFISPGRWVFIGPIHFQAVDVAKLFLILFFADSLSRKEKIMSSYSEGLFPHLFYIALFAGLVLLQPDFSSAFMIILIGVTMVFIAPVSTFQLALTGLAFVPPLIIAVLLSPYKMRRVLAFLNPHDDVQGIGYQVHQSLVSLGHGGVTGVGFARSTQKMFYLPEAHTDFIFAIIGEEWGLIGTLAVVALFGVIMVQGIKIARRSTDRFSMFLAVGITAHFLYYAVINMMVTLQLLPATGLPLPFISYGGTALLVNCANAGILLQLANQGRGKVTSTGWQNPGSIAVQKILTQTLNFHSSTKRKPSKGRRRR